MKTLYLVDFDGTLFNSNELHNDANTFLEKRLRISSSILSEAYEETKKDGRPYYLKKYLEILKIKNIKEIEKEISKYLISLKKSYLYPDSLEFLTKFKHPILIYTFANSKYYKLKLKISKLDKLELPVVMIEGKKNEYLSKNLIKHKNKFGFDLSNLYDKIYWVDDKADGFRNKIEGVEFIRIKREGDKYAGEQTPVGIREISSLKELMT